MPQNSSLPIAKQSIEYWSLPICLSGREISCPPTLGQEQCFSVPVRDQGASLSGVATNGSEVSFID